MKKLVLALLAGTLLAGCMGSMPMQSFDPYTTSDGREGWRMAVRGYDETVVQALLESNIGKNHLCPDGWEITSRLPYSDGIEMIEGQCME